MNNVNVDKLDLFSYLKHENNTLIVLLIFATIIVGYAFTEYFIYAVILSVAIIAIRFFSLNKTYIKYSIVGKNKEYYLFSKILGSKLDTTSGRYSDTSKVGVNYLEEFISDFYYDCNWERLNEVNSFKQILSHISYNHLPNKGNNQITSPQMRRQIENQYTALFKNLDDNEQLRHQLGELHKSLLEINNARIEYNLTKYNF